MPPITPEVVVPRNPVRHCQCASDLAGTAISETLAPGWWALEALPSLDPASVPGKNSLCTLTTASRERMALRLGFCFQLSCERGSTCRNNPSGTPDSACTNRHHLLACSTRSEDTRPRADLARFPLSHLPNTTKRGQSYPYPFPSCLPCCPTAVRARPICTVEM